MTELIYIFLSITILILLLIPSVNYLKRPQNFPPGPAWYLPFFGNTSLVRSLSKNLGGQHKAFEKLSEEYKSPLIGLKLGKDLVVVAFTNDIIKEIHKREEFDGRPDNFFLRLRTMGTRLGITCTDGAHWNEHRSFVVRNLRNLGYGKTKMEVQIQSELKELLELLKNSNQPLWPAEFFPSSVINVLWTFTTGSRIERNDKRLLNFLDLLQKRSKAFDLSGGILSHFPWLRFIAPERIGYSLIKNLNNEFYNFFMEIINEHLNNYEEDKSSDDLIYAFIKEMKMQEDNPTTTFTRLQLTMTILDIFIAGSQTTSITLDLALMMMVIYPDIQEKCYNEIKTAMGERLPNYVERDRQSMPYVEAFLFEVQRFFHIVPISGPRRVLKECELGCYTLPKNTTVLIGLGSVHTDKKFWGDPETFRPERFLDTTTNTIVNTERLTTFGAGRRRCLGDQLARACIFTFFVGILQKFNLKKCQTSPPSLDLLPGIVLSPKPYKIIFEPRQI